MYGVLMKQQFNRAAEYLIVDDLIVKDKVKIRSFEPTWPTTLYIADI